MASGENEKKETGTSKGKPRKTRVLLLQILLVLNTVMVILIVAVMLGLIPKPSLRKTVTPLVESLSPRQASAFQKLQETAKEVQVASIANEFSGEKSDDTIFAANSSKPQNDKSLLLPKRSKMISWIKVEELRRDKKFAKAIPLFRQLVVNTQPYPAAELVCDYFLLRIAQCHLGLSQIDEARKLLENLNQSASPIIRAISFFEQAELELGEEKYLNARKYAYRSIAALGALERPIPLESDCHFLVARALTEKIRSFKTIKKFIRWPGNRSKDPFEGLGPVELRALLGEGKGLMAPAALGPELKISRNPKAPNRWEVTCSYVTAQEVLNQFCDKAGLEISWINVGENVRRRPISLHFRSISPQKFNEVAAGMVGLVGRFTLETASVHDPMQTNMVSVLKEMIIREGISTWRRFFLRFAQDRRLPEGHFALAAIREWKGDLITADHNYQLLARQFERSKVAPRALLRCAKIKMSMMNYPGAQTDLMDLMDLYPDHPGISDVYLLLGKALEGSGDWNGAARTYENLAHRNLSASSRIAASLSAGQCHYHLKNYDSASKWLARYVAMLDKPNPHKYVEAYFLLGKSEAKRNNLDVAIQAYHRGFLGHPRAEVRIPAINELAELHIRQKNFVSALKVLNLLTREKLTSEQSCQKVILEAEVFRSIGLIDKARSILRMELSDSDSKNRSQIGIGLVKCHIATQDYALARSLLMEIIPTLSSEADLWASSIQLASVCIKLNLPDQVVTVLQPILQLNCPVAIRREAASVLGEAYLLKKEYDKAALAFSGLKKEKISQLQKANPKPEISGEIK